MKRLLVLATVAIMSVSMVACSNQSVAPVPTTDVATEVAEVKTMTGDELVALLSDTERFKDALVIDVRKAEAFEAGHIDGAMHISLDEIESRLSELEAYKDKEVVLYCNSGKMSGEAANILVANGFTNVYNAQGVKEYSYTLVQ